MNAYAYSLLGVTAVVAALVGVVVFALLRFVSASRGARQAIRDGRGETALLSTALQDALARLAEQQRATSARAAASEELSAQVFDSLTAGLIVVDGDGKVRITNPAAARMLSLPADRTGAPYVEVLAAAPPLAAVVAEGLSAKRPLLRRALHVEMDGRPWHFGVTVSPLGDGGGSSGVICLFSDLTQVVELEQQLQQKEALARLGELIAGIAHEFRNGLATIHGYSRLIDPAQLPERMRPCIDGIRHETDALSHVVTNFLNFARPEQVLLLPVDVGGVARRVVHDLQPEVPDDARIEVVGTFAEVEADEIMLRQLFANLIRNAVEACVNARVAPHVTLEGQLDSGRLAVRVLDNGPGIPDADRSRIFQPFFTTRSRGSGLGLSIVQKIALLHNARVSVGASPAGGACIELSLPAGARA